MAYLEAAAFLAEVIAVEAAEAYSAEAEATALAEAASAAEEGAAAGGEGDSVEAAAGADAMRLANHVVLAGPRLMPRVMHRCDLRNQRMTQLQCVAVD